ncbi:MAG TPA: redoxin domain-containing protein [Saprospiraceae bacterium]|nr:redoxin domain-containing protein [Saprospiraceae bacterium]
MKRFFALAFFAILSFSTLFADGGGYKIRVKLDNYPYKSITLGFHYGDKQYVKDTAAVDAEGWFTFQADTLLPCGVYLLVLQPDNNFIQVLIPADDQDFTMTTDAKDSVIKMKIKGSDDNTAFYDYLRYLNSLRPEADTLRAQINRTKGNTADSVRLTTKLAEIDKSVKKYQQDLITKHPGFLSTKIVKASIEPEIPEFKGDDKEVQRKKYYWYRNHFFDNIDLADPCLLRSPVLHPKVDQYVTKVTPQHPDSVNVAIDYVIGKMKDSKENYKYYLIHFLNFYAKSTLVGFDACYVHIAKTYYCSGQANWTKKEDVEKICDNANRLEPILIGKIAPNITVTDRENKPHNLWDVDADYTVLFFWAPDCGHCKKAAPFMVEFAKKFKDRGVKVFAVCTAVSDKGPDCWKGVEEKGFTDDLFMNMSDPYIRSHYKTLYDVQTTPQIFILDRKHEILSKRISAEQLPEVMEMVMKFQEEKKKQK